MWFTMQDKHHSRKAADPAEFEFLTAQRDVAVRETGALKLVSGVRQ
jgi:hypothetical protein